MNILNLAIIGSIGLISTLNAHAGAVDLNSWSAQGGSSSWNVQAGDDTVLQTVNGAPTVFFDPSATSTQGTALNGKIKVNDTGDDDFIGFVLGYDSGEVFSSTADYFLVDWKKGDQSGWGEGLAISHVADGSSGNTSGTGGSFWQHTPSDVDLITRATGGLGNTGWVANTEYDFNIVFTNSLIEVKVDNVLQLSINPGDVAGVASFDDGSFGFYNYSQANVLYSSITQTNFQTNPEASECQTSEVPAPTTLAIFGIALAGLGFRRKLKA